MKRASLPIACLLVALLTGAQWLVLQGAAWSFMLATYTARGSLRDGVAKTFDGKHPCCMCKSIKKARTEESAQQKNPAAPVKEDARFVGVTATALALLLPPASRLRAVSFDSRTPAVRTERPPVPPPR